MTREPLGASQRHWIIGSAGVVVVLCGAYAAWLASAPREQSRHAVEGPEQAVAVAPATPIVAPAAAAPRTEGERARRDEPRAIDNAADTTATTLAAVQPASKVDVFVNLTDIDFKLRRDAAGRRDYEKVRVTVTGPNGYRRELEYAASEEGSFDLVNEDGSTLPDGLYKYETYAQTELVTAPRGAQAAAEPDGNGRAQSDARVGERTARAAQAIRSGTFRVRNGQIVQPETEREQGTQR